MLDAKIVSRKKNTPEIRMSLGVPGDMLYDGQPLFAAILLTHSGVPAAHCARRHDDSSGAFASVSMPGRHNDGDP